MPIANIRFSELVKEDMDTLMDIDPIDEVTTQLAKIHINEPVEEAIDTLMNIDSTLDYVAPLSITQSRAPDQPYSVNIAVTDSKCNVTVSITLHGGNSTTV